MGHNLAQELDQYIHDYCPGKSLAKLSFVCHSLGGLIMRAALPHLKSYASKFHSFFSFACPHLGYMYSKSSIVSAGLWVMKVLK